MTFAKPLLLCGVLLMAGVALAQDRQPPRAPAKAPGVSYIVSAQNRSTPLTGGGDYIPENLPGSGIAPFGLGAHAQPFRVRVTCDDGSVGESSPVWETQGSVRQSDQLSSPRDISRVSYRIP